MAVKSPPKEKTAKGIAESLSAVSKKGVEKVEKKELDAATVRQAPSCFTAKQTVTKIIVRYDVGFGNSLYVRGQGANLSWDKGIQLTNVKANEWVWETNLSFTMAEFKVLINDKVFEQGPNHVIKCGAVAHYTPHF